MKNVIALVERELRREFHNVVSPKANFTKFAEDAVSTARIKEQWRLLWQLSAEKLPADSMLLELGSGFGGFISYASKQGMVALGVEPDEERIHISHNLFDLKQTKEAFVVKGVGESLPFPDNCFHVVYSTNVFEHVEDPEAVLSEAIRVLKSGGFLQFVIPNYGSWWEGHYGLVWFPNMPKPLAKIYVRLHGRDPRFLDGLRFINRTWLEAILNKHTNTEIVAWGVDTWEKRLRTLSFSEWASLGRLKGILCWIHRLRLVDIIVRLGKRLHWETPFVLTLRKS